MQKIPVGISSCLLGQPVRFNGGHKLDAYITGTLSEYFDLRPWCPEVGIGLGTPRPTIQLVKQGEDIRCVGSNDQSMDVTDRLREYANAERTNQSELCGYIFKKDSPSCGMERVKVYINQQPHKTGTGIFAEQVKKNFPLLPLEEEGRLGDAKLRENFIQRVYIYHRWRQLLAEGLTPAKLCRFHARHKLIIMTRQDYADLGRLLTDLNPETLAQTADIYIAKLMAALKKIAQPKHHVNVLQHIQGYLKKQLSPSDKAELSELIESYRRGEIPLIVPITILKHHFRNNPDPYIEDSYYMSPYPRELRLLNEL
jgi:uncharacterized protein YbgA (DUF1722 family)/uncharacterized protein YbbK (DUF523 family)